MEWGWAVSDRVNLPELLTATDIADALRISRRTAERFMRNERCARICGKRIMRREAFIRAIERKERVGA